ncbi:MAG TPA: DNA-3-methyladenine glycosylase [Steroidobacteraceae bacterium]|nr:DNA-3-methyladenine glycosylase [Steroidobacteraceae bacterium]
MDSATIARGEPLQEIAPAAPREHAPSNEMRDFPGTPVSRSRKPPRSFFERGTLTVARALIGMHLVHDDGHTVRAGRIVETEAYLGPRDLAAHSARGRTPRTEVMFGPPGHAYVYFIYGFWNLINVVTGAAGVPQAVLLRALEPLAGLTERTWGPGLLCRALHIDRRLNGADLLGDELWLEQPRTRTPALRIARATRIGVDYAGDWAQRPWRFFDRDSPFVSTAPARLRPRAGAAADELGNNGPRAHSAR